KCKRAPGRAWTLSGKTDIAATIPLPGFATHVRAPPATKNARAPAEGLASLRKPNQELSPCTKNRRARWRSIPSESTQSISTGATATAAEFIHGNYCGASAPARNAQPWSEHEGHEGIEGGDRDSAFSEVCEASLA